MPLVVDPIDGDPNPPDDDENNEMDEDDYLASQNAFNNILSYRSDLAPLVPQELYMCIDFSINSNSGVKPYEFNKIRYVLGSHYSKGGFPCTFGHTVSFFSLLMFSMPFYTKMHLLRTMDLMQGKVPSLPLFDKVEYTPAESYKWYLRKVIIYDIPNEFVELVLHFIPFDIDNALVELWCQTSLRQWYIYPNLISYGGLADHFILCNWDFIRNDLNRIR